MSNRRAEVQNRKRQIRRECRSARSAIDPDERRTASNRIADRVVRSPFFQRNRQIACYLPMSDEVDTWPIIARAWRMNKRIFAPICARGRNLRFCEVRPETDLVRNEFGLLEPNRGAEVTARQLDLILVPLVAFDKKGSRIGMGGGYYDTTFSFLRERRHYFRPKLVGLAFARQEIPEIAENPWDIRLYSIITESR